MSALIQVLQKEGLAGILDTSKPSLALALAAIAFNPTAWNIVARNGKPDFCYSFYVLPGD